jgi:hypothetical protein
MTFSLKNDVNVASRSRKQKNSLLCSKCRLSFENENVVVSWLLPGTLKLGEDGQSLVWCERAGQAGQSQAGSHIPDKKKNARLSKPNIH